MDRPAGQRSTVRVCSSVAVLCGFILASALHPRPAAAQADRLDLVGQTVFVTDDPVVIDLRLPRVTEGRQLEIRVHQPITDPEELAAAFADPPQTDIISLFSVAGLDELTVGAGGIISISLPDEEIGLLLRREPGVLPVVIELVDAAGVIDTLVTAVVVEDRRPGSRIDFAFVADARSPLAHRADGTIDVDPEAVVQRVEDAVTDAPGSVLVQLNPETLTALADPAVEDGLVAIDRIRAALDGHELDTRPWVDLDEEGWRRAGETERVFAQYAAGTHAVESFIGRTTSPIARLDARTSADTLELLRGVGINGGVVEPDQLAALDIERADRRPLQTRDRNGVDFTVVPIDRDFEASLDGVDPELVALQRFTELLLEARRSGTDRGIVLDLDTVDRVLLDALLSLADTTDRIGVSTVEALLDAPLARDANGGVLRTDLIATEPSDVSAGASDIRLTESTLRSYVEMVAPADGPITPLRTRLAAAMASELDAGARRTYTDAVFSTVVDGAADFEVLETTRITLATRRAELPLILSNEQPLPINVVVRLTSEKLRLAGGDELHLTLDPGLTELAIPVEAVGSGDARILVQMTSPDGVLDLAAGSIDVRSTAISGLGLIVSLVSLSILLSWWLRTIVRIRRNRRAASVHPAAGTPTDHDPGSPPGPESETTS